MSELLIHKAIEFAANRHNGQKRKGSNTPYIAHLMEVFGILAANNCSINAQIAGILHDVVEDTATEIDEIVRLFGEEIADLVRHETEDKSKAWTERKQATIADLAGAPIEVRQICCADKVSNLISMYADFQIVGDRLWERFSAEKGRIKWYYSEIIAALSALDSFPPYKIMQEYYRKLFEINWK